MKLNTKKMLKHILIDASVKRRTNASTGNNGGTTKGGFI
jgi:hypothetical protein